MEGMELKLSTFTFRIFLETNSSEFGAFPTKNRTNCTVR